MNVQPQERIILLVEDCDDDAFFFERAFAHAGPGHLVRASNGGEAVEFLRIASADSLDLSQTHFVFLDLKLPVLSGFEVLKWIRERGIAVEVVVLSGSDIESDMERARALGASDYLVKPISAQELRERLVRKEMAERARA
jgi:CheY-like chemotaxis protein